MVAVLCRYIALVQNSGEVTAELKGKEKLGRRARK